MNILVVYTNKNPMLAPAPLGASMVADRLRKDGHDVTFLDLMHAKDAAGALRKAIAGARPELAAFSIRNVDNMTAGNLDHPIDDAALLAAEVRGCCDAKMLLGGTAVTTFPGQVKKALGAEYAICGDDLDDVSRFVRSLSLGKPDLATPGLVYDEKGKTRSNPFIIKGYASVKATGYDLIDIKSYRKSIYEAGVITHTGCPNGCSFCDTHRTFGRSYILRDPSDVIAEMKELKGLGARSVWMVNAGLNRPLEYGKELMARIAGAKVRLGFSGIIEPGEFDAEMAGLMAKAGCVGAMIFGTTLDDAVLERNQPFYRSEDVFRAGQLLGEAGVEYFMGLMFGTPGETMRTVEETLEKTLRLKPAMLVAGAGLRVQPDTPLHDVAVREGVVDPSDDCFKPRFYTSPGTSVEEINKRVEAFRRKHPLLAMRMVKFVAKSIWKQIFGV